MSARELRAAATKLREATEAATEGPWEALLTNTSKSHGVWASTGECIALDHSTAPAQRGSKSNATYIALANPVFGLAVADWLDATASTEASYFDDSHALAVARSIIGGGE